MRMLKPALLLFCAVIASDITVAQTWTTPVWSVSPITGTGGTIGGYTGLLNVNGNPAMAYYDGIRGSLMYKRAADINGVSWSQPIVLDSSTDVGQFLSFKIINGNPAIAYYDNDKYNLNYIRSNDANGTSWGTPVVIESAGFVGKYTSLQVINGNPAISYNDGNSGDLKFVRAANANGTAWNTPVTVDALNNTGWYSSLETVNGNPAIAYYDASDFDLKYVRATDADGTGWASPLTLEALNNTGQYPMLSVVNNKPAICYLDVSASTLKYIRASDADGSTWNTALGLFNTANIFQGASTAFKIINGKPGIAFSSNGPGQLKFITAADIDGTTWNPVTTADATTPGVSVSLEIINSYPAIAYGAGSNLKYVQAAAIDGTSWNSPLSWVATGNVGQYTSLQTVNGNPAMSYYDVTQQDLMYVRATNISGTFWGTPVTVDAAGHVGEGGSLNVVNSNPAISYSYLGQIRYARSSDINGTSWPAPVTIDPSGLAGAHTSLKIVNGNPAVAYNRNAGGGLYFTRAVDANGSSWNSPVNLDAAVSVGGGSISLLTVNGNPAMSYYDRPNGNLKFIRATNASGTSWGSPVTIESAGDVGDATSLAIVNGNPAISYYDATNGDLKYVRATDANGTSWGTPVAPDGLGNVGLYTSLSIVNGTPAIAYVDYSDVVNPDLKYIRATDANGTTWGAAVALDVQGRVGLYPSMLGNGSSVAIAYYNQSKALPFYISGTTTTLAVDVTDITANKKNNAVLVKWNAARESNIKQYDLERSADGRNFYFKGTVPATGSSGYRFLDSLPLSGLNFYRIKIVDQSGAITYTQIVKLHMGKAEENTIIVYPNPVQNNIISLQLNLKKGQYSMSLINSAGERVYTQQLKLETGVIIKTINAQLFAPGAYQLVITGAGVMITQKIIKN